MFKASVRKASDSMTEHGVGRQSVSISSRPPEQDPEIQMENCIHYYIIQDLNAFSC